jgi:hypothetical protein
VSNAIGPAGSMVTAIEDEVSLMPANWGQYITRAAQLRVFLGFVDAGDFAGELALGSPSGLIANGQIIDGRSVFIPDRSYTLADR